MFAYDITYKFCVLRTDPLRTAYRLTPLSPEYYVPKRGIGKHYYATFNNLSAFLFTDTIGVTYRMDGTGKTFGLLFSRVILDVSCILVLSGFFIENRSESNKLLNKMFL